MAKRVAIFIGRVETALEHDVDSLFMSFGKMGDIFADRGVRLSVRQWDDEDESGMGACIADSDLALFLFFRELPAVARRQFDAAYGALVAGDGQTPAIFTWFKTSADVAPGMGIDPDLAAFQNELDQRIGHFFNCYSEIDTVRFQTLLQLEREGSGLPFEMKGSILVDDEGNELMDLKDMAAYVNSEKLAEVRTSLETIEPRIQQLKAASLEGDLEDDLAQELAGLNRKRKDLRKKEQELYEKHLEQMRGYVLELASGTAIDPRRLQAIRLISEGRTREAEALLDNDEIEQDGQAYERQTQQSLLDASVSRYKTYEQVSSLLIKAQLLEDRLSEEVTDAQIADTYARAIAFERRNGFEPRASVGYGAYLLGEGIFNKSIDYLENACDQYRRLYEESLEKGGALASAAPSGPTAPSGMEIAFAGDVRGSGALPMKLAHALGLLSRAYAETNVHDKASYAATERIDVLRGALDPDASAKDASDFAVALESCASELWAAGRTDDALDCLAEAVELVAGLEESADHASPALRNRLADLRRAYRDRLLETNRNREAAEQLDMIVDVLRRNAAEGGGLDAADRLSRALGEAAKIAVARNDPKATSLLDESIDVLRSQQAAEPGAQVAIDLSRAHFRAAVQRSKLKDYDGAAADNLAKIDVLVDEYRRQPCMELVPVITFTIAKHVERFEQGKDRNLREPMRERFLAAADALVECVADDESPQMVGSAMGDAVMACLATYPPDAQGRAEALCFLGGRVASMRARARTPRDVRLFASILVRSGDYYRERGRAAYAYGLTAEGLEALRADCGRDVVEGAEEGPQAADASRGAGAPAVPAIPAVDNAGDPEPAGAPAVPAGPEPAGAPAVPAEPAVDNAGDPEPAFAPAVPADPAAELGDCQSARMLVGMLGVAAHRARQRGRHHEASALLAERLEVARLVYAAAPSIPAARTLNGVLLETSEYALRRDEHDYLYALLAEALQSARTLHAELDTAESLGNLEYVCVRASRRYREAGDVDTAVRTLVGLVDASAEHYWRHRDLDQAQELAHGLWLKAQILRYDGALEAREHVLEQRLGIVGDLARRDVRAYLAYLKKHLNQTLYQAGSLEARLELFEQTVHVAEEPYFQKVAAGTASVDDLRDLSSVYEFCALVMDEFGTPEYGLQIARRCIDLYEERYAADIAQGKPACNSATMLSSQLTRLARDMRKLHLDDEAASMRARSDEVLRTQFDQNPGDRIAFVYASVLNKKSNAALRAGKVDEGLRLLDESLDVIDRYRKADPIERNLLWYTRTLGLASGTYRRADRPEHADELEEKMLACFDEMCARRPSRAVYVAYLASLRRVSWAWHLRGDDETAMLLAARRTRIAGDLYERFDDIQGTRLLDDALKDEVNLLQRCGKDYDANETQAARVPALRRLFAVHPTVSLAKTFGYVLRKTADFKAETGSLLGRDDLVEQARELRDERLDAMRWTARRDLSIAEQLASDLRGFVAAFHEGIWKRRPTPSPSMWRDLAPGEACAMAEECVRLLETLYEADPTPERDEALGDMRGVLAQYLAREGDAARAADELTGTIECMRRCLERDDGAGADRAFKLAYYLKLGSFMYPEAGDADRASACLRRRSELLRGMFENRPTLKSAQKYAHALGDEALDRETAGDLGSAASLQQRRAEVAVKMVALAAGEGDDAENAGADVLAELFDAHEKVCGLYAAMPDAGQYLMSSSTVRLDAARTFAGQPWAGAPDAFWRRARWLVDALECSAFAESGAGRLTSADRAQGEACDILRSCVVQLDGASRIDARGACASALGRLADIRRAQAELEAKTGAHATAADLEAAADTLDDEALTMLRDMLEEDAAAGSGRMAQITCELSSALRRRFTEQSKRDIAGALPVIDEAMGLLDRLGERVCDDPRVASETTAALEARAAALQRLGRSDEARADWGRKLEVLGGAWEASQTPEACKALAAELRACSARCERDRDLDGACGHESRRLAVLDRTIDAHGDAGCVMDRMDCLMRLARFEKARGNVGAARILLEERAACAQRCEREGGYPDAVPWYVDTLEELAKIASEAESGAAADAAAAAEAAADGAAADAAADGADAAAADGADAAAADGADAAAAAADATAGPVGASADSVGKRSARDAWAMLVSTALERGRSGDISCGKMEHCVSKAVAEALAHGDVDDADRWRSDLTDVLLELWETSHDAAVVGLADSVMSKAVVGYREKRRDEKAYAVALRRVGLLRDAAERLGSSAVGKARLARVLADTGHIALLLGGRFEEAFGLLLDAVEANYRADETDQPSYARVREATQWLKWASDSLYGMRLPAAEADRRAAWLKNEAGTYGAILNHGVYEGPRNPEGMAERPWGRNGDAALAYYRVLRPSHLLKLSMEHGEDWRSRDPKEHNLDSLTWRRERAAADGKTPEEQRKRLIALRWCLMGASRTRRDDALASGPSVVDEGALLESVALRVEALTTVASLYRLEGKSDDKREYLRELDSLIDELGTGRYDAPAFNEVRLRLQKWRQGAERHLDDLRAEAAAQE